MTKKAQTHEQIFGIRIDSTPKAQVLRTLRSALASWDKDSRSGECRLIVTPNPEIVNRTKKDKNLAEVINSSDHSLLDGIGLAQTVKFLGLPNPKNFFVRIPVLIFQGLRVGYATLFDKEWLLKDQEVIKGRHFFMDLVKLANKKGWRIFLLGGRGVAKELEEVLERSFKKVKIMADDGPDLLESGNPAFEDDIKIEKDIVRRINEFAPHFLFVAFGFPKQEKWLKKWLPDLKAAAAMTVGGTFDYLAGEVETPPKSFESLGLEWLWRLITQPSLKRTKRVLTAFPLFPLKVFWYKLTR